MLYIVRGWRCVCVCVFMCGANLWICVYVFCFIRGVHLNHLIVVPIRELRSVMGTNYVCETGGYMHVEMEITNCIMRRRRLGNDAVCNRTRAVMIACFDCTYVFNGAVVCVCVSYVLTFR